MKAMKIIGGILATIVLAIVVFYLGWLRPPAPEKVCDNVEKLTLAELKSQGVEATDAMKTELRKTCEKRAGTPPEFGRGPWVKKLKCMRDAETMAALETCDGKK
ncbi:hypothetical protein [Enhygromyxa salina]|uniref:Uncharacterized protein n=1 Tax=Enhygromyxa salina TaxID=215803 RepID=A0A2S9XTR4_9BACT|nr:hypothetical protein [Enhygromyxa salina]PRP96233.1 hypothetical protein ENSA7_70470 [Enhygromyxa salina]